MMTLVFLRKDEKCRKSSKSNFKFPSVIKSEIIDLLIKANIGKATEEYKVQLKFANLDSNDVEGSW